MCVEVECRHYFGGDFLYIYVRIIWKFNFDLCVLSKIKQKIINIMLMFMFMRVYAK